MASRQSDVLLAVQKTARQLQDHERAARGRHRSLDSCHAEITRRLERLDNQGKIATRKEGNR